MGGAGVRRAAADRAPAQLAPAPGTPGPARPRRHQVAHVRSTPVQQLGQEGGLVQLGRRPLQQGGHMLKGQRDPQLGLGQADVGGEHAEGRAGPRHRQQVAGLQPTAPHEGHVLADQRRPQPLGQPGQPWKSAAFSQYLRRGKEGYLGRSIRTDRWRYIEWDEGKAGKELYDHETDPKELTNLADKPDQAATQAKLSEQLQAAVKTTFPASGETPTIPEGNVMFQPLLIDDLPAAAGNAKGKGKGKK